MDSSSPCVVYVFSDRDPPVNNSTVEEIPAKEPLMDAMPKKSALKKKKGPLTCAEFQKLSIVHNRCETLLNLLSSCSIYFNDCSRWKLTSSNARNSQQCQFAVIFMYLCLPIFAWWRVMLRVFFSFGPKTIDFLVSDDINLQSVHQLFFKTPICGAFCFIYFNVWLITLELGIKLKFIQPCFENILMQFYIFGSYF